MCDWMTSSDKVHSTRYCREAEKLVDVIFGQWESATNNWVNDNFLLATRHIESLDQWHAVLNSILFKRSWEMESHVINSIQNFLKDSVKSIRQNYKNADFAQKDSRFKYLYHWKLDLSDSDILYIMLSFSSKMNLIKNCEFNLEISNFGWVLPKNGSFLSSNLIGKSLSSILRFSADLDFPFTMSDFQRGNFRPEKFDTYANFLLIRTLETSKKTLFQNPISKIGSQSNWSFNLEKLYFLKIISGFLMNKCLNKCELYLNIFSLCILRHISGFRQSDFFGLYACIRKPRYLKSLRGQFVD